MESRQNPQRGQAWAPLRRRLSRTSDQPREKSTPSRLLLLGQVVVGKLPIDLLLTVLLRVLEDPLPSWETHSDLSER
jgi:hypothetical protein